MSQSCDGLLILFKDRTIRAVVTAAENVFNAFLSTLGDLEEVGLLEAAYRFSNILHDPTHVAVLATLDPHSLPKGEGCPLC